MKTKKPNLSVVIPAWNEEQNIGHLLGDLMKQQYSSFELSEVVVVSDGSIDNTVSIVRSYQKYFNGILSVIDSKARKGLAARQNELLSVAKGDVIVMLQSDIRIEDKKFLEKFTSLVIEEKKDLVSCKIEEVTSTSFIEQIIWVGMALKHSVFESMNNGQNIYTCHGPVRAFSKKFAKSINFKEGVGEDGYSFLYCIANGFDYGYCFNTKVFYKLPDKFNDHKKQSDRYLQSIKIHEKEFGKDFTDSVYGGNSFLFGISFKSIFKYLVIYFIKHPVLMTSYILMQLYIRLTSFKTKKIGKTWDSSASSKMVGGTI